MIMAAYADPVVMGASRHTSFTRRSETYALYLEQTAEGKENSRSCSLRSGIYRRGEQQRKHNKKGVQFNIGRAKMWGKKDVYCVTKRSKLNKFLDSTF